MGKPSVIAVIVVKMSIFRSGIKMDILFFCLITAMMDLSALVHKRGSMKDERLNLMSQDPRLVWVCRYDRVLVAETKMDASSSGRKDNGSPAGKGDGAFNALAKYIFGDNASSTKMQMTTPVFTDDSGTMQFVIDPSFQVRSF